MIGERLLDLRKDAELTQDELAAILRINKHSISSYERDKSEPPDAIKIEIAKYFGVSVDYLLGLTDNPSPYENKNVLVLPNSLPQKAKESLIDFAAYLSDKYSGK
ncbi:MAG: helix-turn-helix domain-containing protein [Negativibacillus sp.]